MGRGNHSAALEGAITVLHMLRRNHSAAWEGVITVLHGKAQSQCCIWELAISIEMTFWEQNVDTVINLQRIVPKVE